MPPPPIPVRTERSNPPPIPDSNEAIEPSLDERDNPSSTAAQAAERDPPQIPDGRRRPAGAVATSMVSGQGGLSSTVFRRQQEEATSEVVDEHSHANNPYDLLAAPGSTVTASYPFHGDEELQQLSFVVSPCVTEAGLV